jgi:hypothetical protein
VYKRQDYLDASGKVIYRTSRSKWHLLGDYNNLGYGVQENKMEKRFRVVNEKDEELFSLPFWDKEYYYEVSPFWLGQDQYFQVARFSMAEMKAKGIESYDQKPLGIGEFKLMDYDLNETEWMPLADEWISTPGMLRRTSKENSRTEFLDLDGQLLFSCDSCNSWYLGNDQFNNRGQWLFKIRYPQRKEEYIGLTGFNFSKELDQFDLRFTDIDYSLFYEEKDENPNFTLNFNEDVVRDYFQKLPKPE